MLLMQADKAESRRSVMLVTNAKNGGHVLIWALYIEDVLISIRSRCRSLTHAVCLNSVARG